MNEISAIIAAIEMNIECLDRSVGTQGQRIDDGMQGLVIDFDYSLDCLLSGYHPLIILISTQQNRNGLTEIDPCICSCRQVG